MPRRHAARMPPPCRRHVFAPAAAPQPPLSLMRRRDCRDSRHADAARYATLMPAAADCFAEAAVYAAAIRFAAERQTHAAAIYFRRQLLRLPITPLRHCSPLRQRLPAAFDFITLSLMRRRQHAMPLF